MKTTITIILLAVTVMVDSGCENTTVPFIKPEFHVRVTCFGYNYPDAYIVQYTNSNWLLSDDIYETFDLTKAMGEVYVPHQEMIFSTGTREDNFKRAVSYANSLKTFQQCVDINNEAQKKYDALINYYHIHPPVFPKVAVKKETECCVTKQIR